MAAGVGVVLQLCLVPGDVGAGDVDEFGGEIRVYGWESEWGFGGERGEWACLRAAKGSGLCIEGDVVVDEVFAWGWLLLGGDEVDKSMSVGWGFECRVVL